MTEVVRNCLFIKSCGQTEVYNGTKWQKGWRHYKDGVICYKHYKILYDKTDRSRELHRKFKQSKDHWRKYTSHRIGFLGKQVYFSWEIRTGYCSQCSANVFDKTCGKTDTHHLFYVPIMPWACTVELCYRCHELTMDNNGRKDLKLIRQAI